MQMDKNGIEKRSPRTQRTHSTEHYEEMKNVKIGCY
jgi:hypothetical protein